MDIKTLNKEYFKRTLPIYNVSEFNNKTITIIGCGGIGSYLAEFIARCNINLNLIDKDTIELSNLGRQNYNLKNINKSKTKTLKQKIKKINRSIKINNFDLDVLNKKNQEKLNSILKETNYIIVSTDNIESKKKINKIATKLKIPTLFLSAFEKYGEIFFTNYKKENSCFNCFYASKNDNHIDLEKTGVIPTTPTIIGLYGFNILLDIINNTNDIKKNTNEKNIIEEKYCNKIFRFNFETISINIIKIKKNKNCEICKDGI